uniref:Uncharacterized protein n=1 Tax=Tetranychus urticae TaxID=32264 RepID=T1KWL4_TETUR
MGLSSTCYPVALQGCDQIAMVTLNQHTSSSTQNG